MKLALSAVLITGAVAPVASLSYLDSLSQGSNPVMSKPAGGSGMNGASYLDALSAPASTSSAPSGSGMSSYLDSLPSGAASAPAWGVSPAPEPEPEPEPVASAASTYELPSWGVPAATDLSGSGIKGYLDGLVSSASSAPTGSGLRGYLDGLPQGPAPSGGGLTGYLDALPRSASAPSGAGIKGYTDSLSPAVSSSPSAYSPSYSSSASSSASYNGYSSSSSDVGFTLEADNLSDLVKQMGTAGTIRLSGTVENVSFN